MLSPAALICRTGGAKVGQQNTFQSLFTIVGISGIDLIAIVAIFTQLGGTDQFRLAVTTGFDPSVLFAFRAIPIAVTGP